MPALVRIVLNSFVMARLVIPYGIYARHRKDDSKLRRAISKEKQRIFLSFNRWRDSILASFGYDPLRCPKCGATMLFLELYHNKKRVPLDELYDKVMQKYKFRT